MNMNETFNLSLSRWHKVAERLSREYTETVHKVTQVFTQTSLATYVGESQEEALHHQAEQCKERLKRAFRLQDSVAQIRQALGDKNAQIGVTAKLAELDKLNRRRGALQIIILGQCSDMIGISELKNTPKEYVADGDVLNRRRPPLRVRMLEQNDLDKLEEEHQLVQTHAYALSDEIAEMNRTTLSLELTEEIANAAGL